MATATFIALGERDCSTQRRHQKVLEETPAPGLTDATRAQLFRLRHPPRRRPSATPTPEPSSSSITIETGTTIREASSSSSKSTPASRSSMASPKQVTGIDLVEWMVLQAAGEMPPLSTPSPSTPHGASIEARVYAEDPSAITSSPLPANSRLSISPPPDIARVETWIESGTTITSFYDPMIAKIIVHGRRSPRSSRQAWPPPSRPPPSTAPRPISAISAKSCRLTRIRLRQSYNLVPRHLRLRPPRP